MLNQNIEQLRKNKYKVRVCHRRYYITDELKPQYFLFSRHELDDYLINNQVGPPVMGPIERGGITTVEVTLPDGTKTAYAVADCSLKDNYHRRKGVAIALGRALTKLEN